MIYEQVKEPSTNISKEMPIKTGLHPINKKKKKTETLHNKD